MAIPAMFSVRSGAAGAEGAALLTFFALNFKAIFFPLFLNAFMITFLS
jgi:hypothetical protein